MAVVSLIRSTLTNKVRYLSVLAGNTALSNNASMFFAGGITASGSYGTSTMSKMPYLTETIAVMPTTLIAGWYTEFNGTAFADGRNFGYTQRYVPQPGHSYDKFNLSTEVNTTYGATFKNVLGTFRGGSVVGSAGYYGAPTDSYKYEYATDTITSYSYLSSFSNIGAYGHYTWSAGTNIYFGGGSTDNGGTIQGGLVKLNTTNNTGASIWTVGTARRWGTGGAENGSSFGYLAGGSSAPNPPVFPTSIFKVNFTSDSTYSTLSATLSSARHRSRVGQSHTICAYYISGRTNLQSTANVVQTTDKLTFATDTISTLNQGTFTETGSHSFNMQ